MPSVDNMFSHCDDIADDVLLMWRLRRSVRQSLVYVDGQLEYGVGLPGFPAFCVLLCPLSPTDPAVLKEEIIRITTTSETLGNKYTIMTGDYATYELA